MKHHCDMNIKLYTKGLLGLSPRWWTFYICCKQYLNKNPLLGKWHKFVWSCIFCPCCYVCIFGIWFQLNKLSKSYEIYTQGLKETMKEGPYLISELTTSSDWELCRHSDWLEAGTSKSYGYNLPFFILFYEAKQKVKNIGKYTAIFWTLI